MMGFHLMLCFIGPLAAMIFSSWLHTSSISSLLICHSSLVWVHIYVGYQVVWCNVNGTKLILNPY
jgi:hypothetical protein